MYKGELPPTRIIGMTTHNGKLYVATEFEVYRWEGEAAGFVPMRFQTLKREG